MSCSEARNLITRQLYEALEPTANSRLTTHLAKCAVCTSEQEVAIRLESRLRALFLGVADGSPCRER